MYSKWSKVKFVELNIQLNSNSEWIKDILSRIVVESIYRWLKWFCFCFCFWPLLFQLPIIYMHDWFVPQDPSQNGGHSRILTDLNFNSTFYFNNRWNALLIVTIQINLFLMLIIWFCKQLVSKRSNKSKAEGLIHQFFCVHTRFLQFNLVYPANNIDNDSVLWWQKKRKNWLTIITHVGRNFFCFSPIFHSF